MKVHTITFLASSISGLSLIACLFVACHIYTDVQSIWDELDMEIGVFRSTTDDLWRDMISIGKKTAFNRNRRQAYDEVDKPKTSGYPEQSGGGKNDNYGPNAPSSSNSAPGIPQKTNPPSIPPSLAGNPSETCGCKTGAENKCPAGPPGPKGVNGNPGLPGFDGLNGVPGKDAEDVSPEHQDSGSCFNCPQGPTGAPGPIGRPGPRGLKGSDGQAGLPGRDGQPGHPGEQGSQGGIGKLGPIGQPGEKGKDADKPIGRPGLKGPRGLPGPQGSQGDAGKNGAQGVAGPQGPPGPVGGQGPTGVPGSEGESGLSGRPGKDAEYCPCPPKGAGVGTKAYQRRRLSLEEIATKAHQAADLQRYAEIRSQLSALAEDRRKKRKEELEARSSAALERRRMSLENIAKFAHSDIDRVLENASRYEEMQKQKLEMLIADQKLMGLQAIGDNAGFKEPIGSHSFSEVVPVPQNTPAEPNSAGPVAQ